MASRLSEDPSVTVLLLEAGGRDNHPWIHLPLGVGRILNNPRFVWPYHTCDEEDHGVGPRYWPKGRLLGGSSSVNGMVFSRGDPEVYNMWAQSGCFGWGWADLLPYFKKMENRPGGDPQWRGKGGPVEVSDVAVKDKLSAAFIEACAAEGANPTSDYNGEEYHGVAPLQFSIRNGRRCSSSVAYLRPARRRPNLHVTTDALADKLNLADRKCVGVTYSQRGGTQVAHARREVILAAGSIESPAILERSGIGSGARLSKLGIETLVDRPSVGTNLIDHFQVRAAYQTPHAVTINDMLGSRLRIIREMLRYAVKRDGLMATSSVTAHAVMKSSPEIPSSDVKIQIGLVSGADRYSVDDFSGFMIGAFQLYPESRGSVHVTTADPKAHPQIRANYLDTESDRQTTLNGLKLVRRLARRPALAGVISREVRPGPSVTSDAELLAYIRSTGQTSWHPVGTCRMGAGEDSVVDHELCVRGVEALRIADASIMPSIPSTNTNAPSMLIGEKAADLIKTRYRQAGLT